MMSSFVASMNSLIKQTKKQKHLKLRNIVYNLNIRTDHVSLSNSSDPDQVNCSRSRLFAIQPTCVRYTHVVQWIYSNFRISMVRLKMFYSSVNPFG